MKKLFVSPLASFGTLALAILCPWKLLAVTAENFGFGNLPAGIGNKPLLLITWQLPSFTGLAHPNGYYDKLVFDFLTIPSVNGYFLENSRGRFLWTRAGVLGPVLLNLEEWDTLVGKQSIDYPSEGITRYGADCGAGIGYLMELFAKKTGYNFAQWDSNGDHRVDNSELYIMIIGNNDVTRGGNRPIGAAFSGQAIPGQNVSLVGKVASLDHQTSFSTFAHEASHSLGTEDLYGADCISNELTLMSCTIYDNLPDDQHTFHLDPWHKMRLGWVRPRIFALGSGGVATVTAAQFQSENTPVILYDPARGTTEYFIVEFRNTNPAGGGGGYDADIGWSSNPQASGLALWHVAPGNDPPVFHAGAPNLTKTTTLWNQSTPPLLWNDGTEIPTTINPIRITPDGREMVFEWITSSDTWVDFHYGGSEQGTFAQPFNTLTEGVNAASHGGTVKLKPGERLETLTISKRLNLEAIGGAVTIGRN